MSITPQHRALLARLEKTLLETSHHLGLIERQIQARAERMIIRPFAGGMNSAASEPTGVNCSSRSNCDSCDIV